RRRGTRATVLEFLCCNRVGPRPGSTDNQENWRATAATFARPRRTLHHFQTSRSRSQSENAPGESRVFRNEPIAVRDEERPVHPTSRAERTRESCEHRALSGTQADRIAGERVVAAAVEVALKKCHTAEMGCAGKTSRLRVSRARAMPARRTSGDNRAPK